MSSSRPSGPDDLRAPGASFDSGLAGATAAQQDSRGGGQTHGQRPSGAQGGPGSSRKKRRRARSQRGKRRHPSQGARPAHADTVSREHIFQDIEGLLRQIREQAEEAATWTEEQLSDFTQAVTSFTKSLEEESDPISDRARGEYQRIRDKLSQALRG